jgi:hypothetical protein
MPNWCWGKWGFKFDTLIPKLSKLPWVNKKYLTKLYSDVEEQCCNPHDDDFDKWWFIIAFLRANYKFALRLIHLLRWTTVTWRFSIFILAFFWLCIFWIRYFNWTSLWDVIDKYIP